MSAETAKYEKLDLEALNTLRESIAQTLIESMKEKLIQITEDLDNLLESEFKISGLENTYDKLMKDTENFGNLINAMNTILEYIDDKGGVKPL